MLRMSVFFALFFFVLTSICNAKVIILSPSDINDVTVDIDDYQGVKYYKFRINIADTFFPDDTTEIKSKLELPLIEIRYSDNNHKVCDAETRIKVGLRYVMLFVAADKNTERLFEILDSGHPRIYIYFDSSLVLETNRGDTLIIPKDVMKDVSKDKEFVLDKETMYDVIETNKWFPRKIDTKIDAGVRTDKNDMVGSEGYLSFHLLLDTFLGDLLNLPSMEAKGNVSTEEDDPSSYVSLSPLMLKLGKEESFFLKLSYDFNQNGSEQRITGSLFYQDLLKFNIVDFAKGQKRFRPFPAFEFGLDFNYYTSSENSERSQSLLAEMFLNVYYFIPVKDKYSLLVEGFCYWETNEDFDFLYDNIDWIWDFTVGYQIMGKGTEVMAKYSVGANDLNTEKDEKLLVGVLFDIFKK